MSEELRAREVLARTKREAPANLQFDPDAIAVCAMLSFASSAAGQREGWEKARDALEVVAGGDLDVSGTAIIVGNGAAAVMGQVRDALEAIASPSAPEERRDEVERLREALKPFAAYADSILRRRDGASDEPVAVDRLVFGIDGTHVTIGDLRRARAALTPVPGER